MKQRILVVEDETAIASVLDALLTEAGYEVTLATDGVQGLQAFHRQSFSLILLDLMMPQVDGYTVCRQIRQESQVPIVVLTALDGEDAQVKAFQLKADDYITKPFSLQVVLLRVEAVRAAPGTDGVLPAEAIHLARSLPGPRSPQRNPPRPKGSADPAGV